MVSQVKDTLLALFTMPTELQAGRNWAVVHEEGVRPLPFAHCTWMFEKSMRPFAGYSVQLFGWCSTTKKMSVNTSLCSFFTDTLVSEGASAQLVLRLGGDDELRKSGKLGAVLRGAGGGGEREQGQRGKAEARGLGALREGEGQWAADIEGLELGKVLSGGERGKGKEGGEVSRCLGPCLLHSSA